MSNHNVEIIEVCEHLVYEVGINIGDVDRGSGQMERTDVVMYA